MKMTGRDLIQTLVINQSFDFLNFASEIDRRLNREEPLHKVFADSSEQLLGELNRQSELRITERSKFNYWNETQVNLKVVLNGMDHANMAISGHSKLLIRLIIEETIAAIEQSLHDQNSIDQEEEIRTEENSNITGHGLNNPQLAFAFSVLQKQFKHNVSNVDMANALSSIFRNNREGLRKRFSSPYKISRADLTNVIVFFEYFVEEMKAEREKLHPN